MQPGDRWDPEINLPVRPLYRADGIEIPANWTPSIHMPRWASRITLEIGEIRVERLQDMTDSDARSEGICDDGELVPPTAPRMYGYASEFGWRQPKQAFAHMWDALYAKRGLGWDANPWVWAITFRRLEAAQ